MSFDLLLTLLWVRFQMFPYNLTGVLCPDIDMTVHHMFGCVEVIKEVLSKLTWLLIKKNAVGYPLVRKDVWWLLIRKDSCGCQSK